MQPAEQTILFEYPAIERVRNYLRLESLFVRFAQVAENENTNLNHVALLTLFEIMDCAARAELKLDILQELGRQKQRVLNVSDRQPELSGLLDEIQICIDDLQKIQHKFGQHLRENEWLMGIKQRMAVAGGTSPVDLPSYYFWQKLAADERHRFLQDWAQALMPTGNAVYLLMKLLRTCTVSTECVAYAGNYQQPRLGHHVHLVQIEVDRERLVLPEVSANKYMMHVRFVAVDFQHTHGKQINSDLPFRLLMCSFDDVGKSHS